MRGVGPRMQEREKQTFITRDEPSVKSWNFFIRWEINTSLENIGHLER